MEYVYGLKILKMAKENVFNSILAKVLNGRQMLNVNWHPVAVQRMESNVYQLLNAEAQM